MTQSSLPKSRDEKCINWVRACGARFTRTFGVVHVYPYRHSLSLMLVSRNKLNFEEERSNHREQRSEILLKNVMQHQKKMIAMVFGCLALSMRNTHHNCRRPLCIDVLHRQSSKILNVSVPQCALALATTSQHHALKKERGVVNDRLPPSMKKGGDSPPGPAALSFQEVYHYNNIHFE